MAKKKFIVQAKVITYCNLIVEADSIEEANDIALDTDGGDFTPSEKGGDFDVQTENTREATEKEIEEN